MMPTKLQRCSILVTLWCSCAGAASYTIDGRTEETWSKGALFVVVATVKTVHPVERMPEDATTHVVTLVPHATLAGSFDAGLQPEITAPMSVGLYETSIKSAPPAESLAIVVVLRRKEHPSLCVAGATIAFVPGGSALTVVTGWDDPRIAETLKRIQTARAKPTTQPTDGAPTQPATQPGK